MSNVSPQFLLKDSDDFCWCFCPFPHVDWDLQGRADLSGTLGMVGPQGICVLEVSLSAC
jgi:hypothetical protein